MAFQPVSPDELKMTSEPLAPGAPAIILYRQVDRDDNIHTPHEDNYFRIKILTEEGRKHADVEIPFLKENAGRGECAGSDHQAGWLDRRLRRQSFRKGTGQGEGSRSI